LVKRGKSYWLRIGPDVKAQVQPFLFDCRTSRVRLNWEHTDYRWTLPRRIPKFKLIPKFDLTLKALDLA